MQEINLNMYHAVALGALMFWLGDFLTAKISVLNRFCIPAPLVGGLCFAIVNTIMYALGIVVITFDDTLQTVFMTMFFTTVGYTVSLPALFKGGKSVLLLLGLGLIMILLQNGLGGAVMYLMDENPLYGIGCGSIALIGGPGTAAGIGPDLEAAGAQAGTVVSVAAATFGVGFVLFHHDNALVMTGGIIMSLLTLFMHRGNIVRLVKGEERKTNLLKNKGSVQ